MTDLKFFDKENVFYIHGLRKNLADFGEQKKIKQQIANYFSTPAHVGSKTDISKSSLWMLQTLRNQAMHGNIIKISNNKLIFSYTIPNEKYTFCHIIKNPAKYFGAIFKNLSEFAKPFRYANTQTKMRTKSQLSDM